MNQNIIVSNYFTIYTQLVISYCILIFIEKKVLQFHFDLIYTQISYKIIAIFGLPRMYNTITFTLFANKFYQAIAAQKFLVAAYMSKAVNVFGHYQYLGRCYPLTLSWDIKMVVMEIVGNLLLKQSTHMNWTIKVYEDTHVYAPFFEM